MVDGYSQVRGGSGSNWLNLKLVRKMGNVVERAFGRSLGEGETPFCLKYSRLFTISNKKGKNGGV